MKKIQTLIALLFVVFTPIQTVSAINISPQEYRAAAEGIAHAPVGDIEQCGPGQGTQVSPGLVYIIGDSTIDNDLVRPKLDEAFSSNGWSLELDTQPRETVFNAENFSDEQKDRIIEAKHIVVALGGFERDIEKPVDDVNRNIVSLINSLKGLSSEGSEIYWVNVGSSANGTGKDGVSLEGNEFSEATPSYFSSINAAIQNGAGVLNYKLVNWYKYVFGSDSDPTSIDPTQEDSKGYLQNNKYNLTEVGADAWVANLSSSVTGSSSNTDENGDLVSSGDQQATGAVLDGTHQLPATKGGIALEGDVGADGRLVSKNSAGHDIGDSVSFGQHASYDETGNPQAYRDYYITMRWRYAAWPWNNDRGTKPGPEDAGWYAEKPRLVLVTNPETGKSIITAILESGPAPWGGTVGGSASKTNPPAYWGDGFVVGTPEGYDGRVGGLTQKGMEALGAVQWGYGGPGSTDSRGTGSELLFAWAPDQNAIPGPTALSVGSVGCLSGNTIGADGLFFPLAQVTKKDLERGSANDTGAVLKWPPTCTEIPGQKGRCHHNYYASDLHISPGWPVIAMQSGIIASANDSRGENGGSVQIKGIDGFLYFYSHLDPDSLPVGIERDAEVPAGTVLGTVGAARYAQGTAPHVHVDILPPSYETRPSCSGAGCSSHPFQDVQSILVRLYQGVPE